MDVQNTTLIVPGTQAKLGNMPDLSIRDAFRQSLSGNSSVQSESIKASIDNLSQELSSQLQRQDSTDSSFALENSTLDSLFFEDSNDDGIINEGDNIVISFTDDFGEKDETRVPVTEELASLIQGINSSDLQGVNAVFMDQFLTIFIEQMKVEILHQNSQIRDMISESSPDLSF